MVFYRNREQRLPVYERTTSPTKERFSDDDGYYPSSDDYEAYPTRSSNSSRSTSGSIGSGVPMIPKRRAAVSQRLPRVYPYRLPAKVTRYLCFGLGLILFLMITSLIRASQVENWKIANGETHSRPPPPPLWERFPFLERYYGGIKTLATLEESNPEYPKSHETGQTVAPSSHRKSGGQEKRDDVPESHPWGDYVEKALESDINECFIDSAGRVSVPPVRYYQGRPTGFPRNVAGSYEVLDLPEDICFDRYGRFGPYGFGYPVKKGGLGTGEGGHKDGSASVWADAPRVDFRGVDWAEVQRRCYEANAARYQEPPFTQSLQHGFHIHSGQSPSGGLHKPEKRDVPEQGEPSKPSAKTAAQPATKKPAVPTEKKSRTAVVVRCYDEYFFREDDIASLRSMITELSLASGGRYDVHLLVQVKNDAQHPIWADQEAYQKRIHDSIPEEFRGLVTLWTETQMLSIYQGIYDLYSRGPDLPVHGVYRGLSMAMQYFAYQHPEYEYFWQWEMDVRYTGHYYDLFAKLEDWAKAQPRKGLWERNGRFYFPDVHGSWEDFSQMARIQNEMGTVNADNLWANAPGLGDDSDKANAPRKIVWGPQRPTDDNDWFEPGKDPKPPVGGPESDKYEWGVGEEADFITLNPLFNPEDTTWGLKDDITGFNRTNGGPPRRASIITTSRMSRQLLLTMHKLTAYKKQFAFPEMWPATVALQHGLKAVSVPHPLYVDRKWPLDYMSQVYNGGRDGSVGGSRNSVYGDREHNMHGLSWFYNSGFGPNLYRRWLGLKVNNDGGEEFEQTADSSKEGGSVGSMPGGEGRMCLPPMLLHPVKEVELPVEEEPVEDDHKIPEFDPGS